VLHLHLPLSHQAEVILGQQVVDLADGAGGGVFDGEHGIVRLPPGQGLEHIPEPGKAPGLHPLSEEAGGGLLGIGSRLPLVDHPGIGHRLPLLAELAQPAGIARVLRPLLDDLVLLAAGEGHDGLKKAGHRRPVGGGGSQSGAAGNDLLLPLGVQHRQLGAALIFPHLGGDLHPAQEQLGKAAVNGVQPGAAASASAMPIRAASRYSPALASTRSPQAVSAYSRTLHASSRRAGENRQAFTPVVPIS
jgi:hypothetical protein